GLRSRSPPDVGAAGDDRGDAPHRCGAGRREPDMEDVQEQAVPILRVADAGAAAAWYARLGFAEEWVHRFEPGFPAFVSVARGEVRLFLSEHTGDARPDTLVHLWVRDVDAVAAEFGAPVEEMPWGRQVDLRDPDGNRLRAAAAPGADRPGGGGRDAGLRLPFPLVYTGDVDRPAGFYTGLPGFTDAFRVPAHPSLPAGVVHLALGPPGRPARPRRQPAPGGGGPRGGPARRGRAGRGAPPALPAGLHRRRGPARRLLHRTARLHRGLPVPRGPLAPRGVRAAGPGPLRAGAGLGGLPGGARPADRGARRTTGVRALPGGRRRGRRDRPAPRGRRPGAARTGGHAVERADGLRRRPGRPPDHALHPP